MIWGIALAAALMVIAVGSCVHIVIDSNTDYDRDRTGISINTEDENDGQGNNRESVDGDETGRPAGESDDEGAAAEGDN